MVALTPCVASGDHAAPATHGPPDQEHDDRADYRADDARCGQLEGPAKDERRERAADERSDDALDHGAEPTHRARTRGKSACDEVRAQSDGQEGDDARADCSVLIAGG